MKARALPHKSRVTIPCTVNCRLCSLLTAVCQKTKYRLQTIRRCCCNCKGLVQVLPKVQQGRAEARDVVDKALFKR